jgi:hypothetical protein
MIVGDGYIPYHIRVFVDTPSTHEFTRFVRTAAALKEECERTGGIDRFPETVTERLAQIPGVTQVYPFGGYSAVFGALKMIRSFAAQPCGMYGVIGTGPVATAIQQSFTDEGIALFPTVRTAADSSIEITMINRRLHALQEFQIHFLRTRERSHILRPDANQEEVVTGLLFSRPNRSRAQMAKRLFGTGRLVSVRVHGFSRYVGPQDYLDLLPYAQQVFVRYEEMRQMGRALGIPFPRGWQPTSPDTYLHQFVQRLATHGESHRLVAVACARDAYLYVPDLGLVQFRVPETQRQAVSDTRFHGALITQSLQYAHYLPTTRHELEDLGNRALQASYHGYDALPLVYPDPTFACTGSWEKR